MISGFLTAGGAANFGWFAYAPLSGAVYSPGRRRRPLDRGVVVTSTAGVLDGGQHRHHDLHAARARA